MNAKTRSALAMGCAAVLLAACEPKPAKPDVAGALCIPFSTQRSAT